MPVLILQYCLKEPRPWAHLPGIWQGVKAEVQRGYLTS